jgi:hypothetical protein
MVGEEEGEEDSSVVEGVGSACAAVVEVSGMTRRAEEGARELRPELEEVAAAGGGEGEGWREGGSDDMSLVAARSVGKKIIVSWLDSEARPGGD